MSKFPDPQDSIFREEFFGDREVGLTHPDVSSFLRIKDSGDIEIFAAEGLAIIMNVHSRSITFVADTVKFVTREDGGLRWNRVCFNDRAVSFNEPTFLSIDDVASNNLYSSVEDYYG